MTKLGSFDRRLGQRVRDGLARVPGGPRVSRVASASLAPAFETLVVGLLARPRAHRAGFEALLAGAGASTVARLARDAIGRPRPGSRADGGFPSRHAAAAVAITRAAARHHPRLRPWLAGAAFAGLAGRVADGQHDPSDIVAGVILGWSVDCLVGWATG